MLILPTSQILLIDKMQKTKFKELLDSLFLIIKPLISYSWSRRSTLIISLLSGFYFTNSLISFLLDNSVNTIYIAISLLLIMEIIIQTLQLYNFSKISILIVAINNFRIGSTYALILEAFKLGS